MTRLNKLPLYAGLAVFVIAVIVSSIKLGEKSSLTYNKTRASVAGSLLSLKFSQPDRISVTLNSDKEIVGADLVIKYDKNKVKILPSTLSGENTMALSGGVLDEAKGTFSFSILPKNPIKAGILASFKMIPANNLKKVDSELLIIEGTDGSAVLDQNTMSNILSATEKVQFSLSSK